MASQRALLMPIGMLGLELGLGLVLGLGLGLGALLMPIGVLSSESEGRLSSSSPGPPW